MSRIFHITPTQEWTMAQVNTQYVTRSLAKEGFIHCSLVHQILGVANYKYKGQTDLVLLEIDESKVSSIVKYEDLYNLNEEYPHIYGPLNLDAVLRVIPFPPMSDGKFNLPQGI